MEEKTTIEITRSGARTGIVARREDGSTSTLLIDCQHVDRDLEMHIVQSIVMDDHEAIDDLMPSGRSADEQSYIDCPARRDVHACSDCGARAFQIKSDGPNRAWLRCMGCGRRVPEVGGSISGEKEDSVRSNGHNVSCSCAECAMIVSQQGVPTPLPHRGLSEVETSILRARFWVDPDPGAVQWDRPFETRAVPPHIEGAIVMNVINLPVATGEVVALGVKATDGAWYALYWDKNARAMVALPFPTAM